MPTPDENHQSGGTEQHHDELDAVESKPLLPRSPQSYQHAVEVGLHELELLEEEECELGEVVYRASFTKFEQNFVNYRIACWVLLCFPCILLYGLGLLMFFWTPVIAYIARKEIQSTRLYITSENVVVKRAPPATCPCLGRNESEKHVLLHLVTDVILTQGWLARYFGIHYIKIENPGQAQRGAQGADLEVVAVENPRLVKKLLLTAAAAKRNGKAITKELVDEWAKSGFAGSYDGDDANGIDGYGGQLSEHAVIDMTQSVKQLNETLVRLERLATLHLQATGQVDPALLQQSLVATHSTSSSSSSSSSLSSMVPAPPRDML
eukprot:CAMPEP_0177655560 /NCGR_PEP_ID=MMETSP0447-20121125/15046_1 /TAXON_ID=0 /ORGANISM="Stygamoeba regulata, Strain BSH-02190019" /LENGTH=321 /DNA_ID=CAMNT_0019159515 /DNA_START=31 /DNA_END=996 /DNA_ORIENTATION=+